MGKGCCALCGNLGWPRRRCVYREGRARPVASESEGRTFGETEAAGPELQLFIGMGSLMEPGLHCWLFVTCAALTAEVVNGNVEVCECGGRKHECTRHYWAWPSDAAEGVFGDAVETGSVLQAPIGMFVERRRAGGWRCGSGRLRVGSGCDRRCVWTYERAGCTLLDVLRGG